jgi:tight adherence protein B
MTALVVVTAALAAAALAVTVAVLFGQRQASMERRLAGYEHPDHAAPETAGPETRVVQRGVALAGRLAERSGVLSRVERALERADLPVRASELIFYTLAGAVFVFLAVTLLGAPFVGAGAALTCVMLPGLYVSYKQRTRARAFEHQLPDTLTLLAGSLRAGFSFMQGLEAVAQEIGAPMRRELQRVFTEVRLGRAPEDALGGAAARMQSRDLAWTVMAIKIQREVGGNLAALLDTVADTMTKRDRIRREIRALTAEGRLSAIVLAAVPPVIGALLVVVAPDYIRGLFDETIGIVALAGAALLAVVGSFWLRRIIDIEV